MANFNMKKTIFWIVIITGIIIEIIIYVMSYSSRYINFKKDISSEFFGGLNRKVTIYNYGLNEPIKEYKGKIDIYVRNNKTTVTEFILNGKRIFINGGLVIIEEE